MFIKCILKNVNNPFKQASIVLYCICMKKNLLTNFRKTKITPSTFNLKTIPSNVFHSIPERKTTSHEAEIHMYHLIQQNIYPDTTTSPPVRIV